MGTAADLAAVVDLERGAATAPHWPEGEYAAVLTGEGGAVRRVLFCADIQGVVEGFAVGKVLGAEGELESVVVGAGQRGRGVGRALCGAVLGWCAGAGAGRVMLEVRVGSVGAVRLYERLGFVEVGRRKGYYAGPMEDAVVMRWVAGA